MERGRRQYSRWAFLGRLAERSARGYLEDACPQVAGAIAYRVIFSLFPLAIVLTAISAITIQVIGSQDTVVDAMVRNVPLSEDGKQEMRTLLEGATGSLGGLGLLGLIPLAWAATGMMGAIRYGLNRAWDVSERRPFFQGKAFDLLFVVVALVLVGISLVLSVGTSVAERHAAGLVEWIGLDAAVVTWLFGRLAPFALAFLGVLAAYRLLPAAGPTVRQVWPSALGVAALLALLQSLFGLYLSHVNDFNAVYGSLAAVIAFVYFVYLAANVFLFGAEVAAATPRVRDELARAPAGGEGDGTPFLRQLLGAARGLVIRDDGAPMEEDEREDARRTSAA